MRPLQNFLLSMIMIFGGLSLTAQDIQPQNERNFKIKRTFKISVKGHLTEFTFRTMIPYSIKGRQTVNSIDYSIQPDSIYTKNKCAYAVFKLYDVEDDFKIIIEEDMTIYRHIGLSDADTDSSLAQYLVAENSIESESEEIQKLADKLKERTDIETVVRTFSYVKDNITYERKDAIGAKAVLESGVGKCMDFSDLFVALLRANKIPAKSIFGMVLRADETIGYHAWPEAYLKKQGWVKFDPTTGHTDIRKEGNNYKMSIKNKYVALSEGRNNPELISIKNDSQLGINGYRYWWKSKGAAEVKIKRSKVLL